jgi:C-terminal processing protease CtpA/Prc
MSNWKKTWVMAMLVTLCIPVLAQENDDELEAKMREAERRLVESEHALEEVTREAELRYADYEREMAETAAETERRFAEYEREMARAAEEMERQRTERGRIMRDENVEIEIRMREAEAALADAAHEVAELSRHNLPRVAAVERIMRTGNRPVLGITIGSGEKEDPVEGVTILGVSPGGAADEAGLRAGDVITSINDESLTADNERAANEKLLDFMKGVEEQDKLSVEYLRNGSTRTVEVSPRPVHGVFAFNFDGSDFTVPIPPIAPHVSNFENRFVWLGGKSGFGDMEMVKLTERLGSYFGTDEGILIVRAPENEELKLQDGDVIQSIDGRKPKSVNHAMRILASYQSGETVEVEIMRDKRRQTISIDIPDNRQSRFVPNAAPEVRVVPKVKVVTMPAEPM